MRISKECEKLRPKKHIPEIDETGDYRFLSADALAALDTAYRNGDSYAMCVKRVIDNYANGGVQ